MVNIKMNTSGSLWLDHCHIYQHGRPEDKRVGTVSHLKRVMKELQADKALVFGNPVYIPPRVTEEQFDKTNEWFLTMCQGENDLLPAVHMNPKANNAVKKLEEYAQRGAVGIKLHPITAKIIYNDSALEDFYQAAEELNLPITFHTGIHGWYLKNYRPLLLDEIAQNHPKLSIILAHVGGKAFFNEALAVLHNNPNTYAGLTQMRSRALGLSLEQKDMLLTSVKPERLIYGTDFPFMDIEVIKKDIEYIMGWPVSKEAKTLILGGSLKRLYNSPRT